MGEATTTIRIREEVTESCSVGNGGWVLYQSKRLSFPVFLRVSDGKTRRLEIVELYIAGGAPITGSVLRQLDLNRIEGLLNEASGQVGQLVRQQLGLPSPDLRRLAGYYSTMFGFAGRELETLNWVELSFLAQDHRYQEIQAPEAGPPAPFRPIEYTVEARLQVPAARPYGDDFYRQVADLYRQLLVVTKAPAGAIADVNGVSISQVHQWVKVARERNFLGRGQKGKAST